MDHQNTYTLIEGEFLPKESREILFSIYKSKMRFHQMKNFSSQECLGKDDQAALKRITQLKQTLESIAKVIDQAEQEGKVLKINSEISLRFIDTE